MKSGLFSGIIGHKAAKEALERAVENSRLAHAYLLIGTEGAGRTILAQTLIEKEVKGKMEGHPNVMIIKRLIDEKTSKKKSVISVDQIREVRERMAMSALGGGKQAVFIEEADRMHQAAANALLKTLEEPKAETLIILRAPAVESVPATIASRCQIIRFNRVAKQEISTALVKRGISPDDADRCANLSMGRPGLALRLMTDGALRSQMEIAVSTLFTLANDQLPERLKSVANFLPKSEANKAEVASVVLDGWEQALRDLMLRSLGCNEMVVFTKEVDLDQLAKTKNVDHWSKVLSRLSEARSTLHLNGNPLLALEHVVLAL